MTSYNNTFEGTISKGCTPQVIGRVIGIRGTGIRRITDKIRTDHPGSRPFIRADRDTSSFTLSTRGDNGLAALKAMAAIVNAEINWITNGTGVCPHPMIDVPSPAAKELNKHIIGVRGIFLRDITERIARGEHGPGCFIVHKPDLDCYRIEGITQAQVELGERRLRSHIEKVIASQNPTRIDLDGTRAPPATTTAPSDVPASTPNEADTNSFASLAASSSDDEDSEGESEGESPMADGCNDHSGARRGAGDGKAPALHEMKENAKTAIVDSMVRLLNTDPPASIEWNRKFNRAKTELARICDIPFHEVKDQDVNAFMNKTTCAGETAKPSVASYDTSSAEDFPAVAPVALAPATDGNIKLQISTSAWANGPGKAATMPPNLGTASPPGPTAKFMGRAYNTKPSDMKKPKGVTHIPLEPFTPPTTPTTTPPTMLTRQATNRPSLLQESASKCSADEQMRIAECMAAAASATFGASAFDGPCPTSDLVDSPRDWGDSSSDDDDDI